MALNLRLDLEGATFADLEALLAAARAGGIDKRAVLRLEDSTLILNVAAPAAPAPAAPKVEHTVGDAAVRSVIDILTGRQAPEGR